MGRAAERHGNQGGLADVGIADQAGVGEETQFQTIVAGFAGAAELVLAWRLVGGGGEVLVAAPAATAAGDDDFVIWGGEVVDELACVVVVKQGADGDVEDGVGTGGAGHVGAEAVAAALGLPLGVEAEVDEGVMGKRGAHEDVTAVAAVSAGGAAAGYEFFAAKGHGAVAAVAGFDSNSGFVDEHAACGSQGLVLRLWLRATLMSLAEAGWTDWAAGVQRGENRLSPFGPKLWNSGT